MKKIVFLFILVVVCAFSAAGQPEGTENYRPISLNVKDYGAVGDGKADDTAAIQAVFDEAHKQMRVTPAGYLAALSTPEVFFPSGVYSISKAVEIKGMSATAEPYTVIRQTDPKEDIFWTKWAYQMNISGFYFVGGKNQLNLWNGNLGGGVINIYKCCFSEAGNISLIADVESTTVNIEKCSFLKNAQAMLLNRTDVAVIRDCWLENCPDTTIDRPLIENHAQRLLIENICGNPRPNGKNQRWIDNYGGNLTMRQCRFGGEGGGFIPVISYAKPGNIGVASSLVLEDSWACNTTTGKYDAVVYFVEIPNIISIRNNSSTAQHLIKFDKKIDFRTYFADQKIPSSMLSFEVANNAGVLTDNKLPKGLVNPVGADEKKLPKITPKMERSIVKGTLEKFRANRPADLTEAEYQGHKMQTDPAKYFCVTQQNTRLSTDMPIDATKVLNSEFLTANWDNGDFLIVWKRNADLWPMIDLTHIEVDLDKTPFLSFRLKESDAPDEMVIRVLDPAGDRVISVCTVGYGDYTYHAFDLRKVLGKSGKLTLGIRIYPAPWGWDKELVQKHGYNTLIPGIMPRAKQGSCCVFDFIRFEEE